MKKNISEKYANLRYRPTNNPLKNKAENIRIKKIVNAVGEEEVVLDIGCFDGTIGELLLKKGNKVYGIEISKDAVNIAKKRGIIVKNTSAEKNFPFEDKFFDVVIAGEIIEHLLDTVSFLKEIKRVLKDNGRLILTTPNVASLGRRFYLLFGKNPYFEAAYGFPPNADAGHIRFFTKKLLIDFLNYVGFEIIKYESTVVNMGKSGKLASEILAKIVPTIGACHFVIGKKMNNNT